MLIWNQPTLTEDIFELRRNFNLILGANNLYVSRSVEWHYFYLKILNSKKVIGQNVTLAAPKNDSKFTQKMFGKSMQIRRKFPKKILFGKSMKI